MRMRKKKTETENLINTTSPTQSTIIILIDFIEWNKNTKKKIGTHTNHKCQIR